MGTVVDDDGRPLAGATITITGPALQGERKAVADAEGRFRVPLVPVGRDYRMTAFLAGFQGVLQTDITAKAGADTRVAFTLADDSGSRYEITVAAETPMVDPKKSSISETVTLEAEYGRATGAVSNVVTKSGGNELHGAVPVYYTNLDLKQHQESDRTAVEEEDFYEVEPGI